MSRLAESIQVAQGDGITFALTRAIAVIGPATMILVSILIAWLIISVMTALMSVNDLLK